MVRVFFAVILSLLIAYFAIQNTSLVAVTIAGYTISDTPLYVVVIASVLFGLFIGFIFYLLHAVSSSFFLRGKAKELHEAHKTVAELTKRVHQLEIENVKLSGENDNSDSL